MKRAGLDQLRCRAAHDAPPSQATNMSKTERSKVMSKVWEKRSSAVGRSGRHRSTKGEDVPWATITPFGMPVLPDVKSR